MKLTADQYYYVYFCMFEEPAMFKPLSYSSEFVSIRQPLVLLTDNASFKAKKHTSRQSRYTYVNGPNVLESNDIGNITFGALCVNLIQSNLYLLHDHLCVFLMFYLTQKVWSTLIVYMCKSITLSLLPEVRV